MADMLKRARGGRPPAGVRPGEKSSEYHQLTLRIPPEALRHLDALAGVLTLPRWRVVVQAVAAYAREGAPLSDDQARAVRAVLRAQKAGRLRAE
jgi:predicted transcriptional regulator